MIKKERTTTNVAMLFAVNGKVFGCHKAMHIIMAMNMKGPKTNIHSTVKDGDVGEDYIGYRSGKPRSRVYGGEIVEDQRRARKTSPARNDQANRLSARAALYRCLTVVIGDCMVMDQLDHFRQFLSSPNTR